MRATIALVMIVLGTGAASAQEAADPHPTALSVVGGLSVGSSPGLFGHGGGFGFNDSNTGFVVGGGLAHDLTPRFTLEASGLYLDRGASAWSADAGLRINLVPSERSLVPYFAASGGVYSERAESPLDEIERIPVVGPLARNVRHGLGRMGLGGILDTETHTDGMLTLGGGIRIASGEHVFVRPDVRAQVVFGDDTRVLGLFTLNFGYRF